MFFFPQMVGGVVGCLREESVEQIQDNLCRRSKRVGNKNGAEG